VAANPANNYGKAEDCRIESFDCGHELFGSRWNGRIGVWSMHNYLWRPVAARHDANAFSTLASAPFLEGFQESYQVGSFLARENEAQMSLVVANHIFERRGDSVVEVRRARGEGA
jgi:hypothetical protein